MSEFWQGTARTAEWVTLVILVGLGLGVVWAGVDHGITKLADRIWPPKESDADDLEILVGYAPRSFATKAAKGFRSDARTDHRATIVDLQERRRAR